MKNGGKWKKKGKKKGKRGIHELGKKHDPEKWGGGISLFEKNRYPCYELKIRKSNRLLIV